MLYSPFLLRSPLDRSYCSKVIQTLFADIEAKPASLLSRAKVPSIVCKSLCAVTVAASDGNDDEDEDEEEEDEKDKSPSSFSLFSFTFNRNSFFPSCVLQHPPIFLIAPFSVLSR